MQEITKKIADRFGCGYQVFEKGSDPKRVEEAYHAAFKEAKEVKKEEFYPAVVCLTEYAAEWLTEAGADTEDYRQKLIDGCQDHGQKLLQVRYEEYIEDLEEGQEDDLIGTETEGDILHEFTSYCSFRDGTLEADTILLRLPVRHPWEVIAYLPMGGWNDCPAPEDMISICKYWYEKYEAVPAVFTHDVMEFYAPKRLNGVDRIEAAKEHYAFCTDRVDQGTRTYKISELAAGLEQSSVWYFWWD